MVKKRSEIVFFGIIFSYFCLSDAGLRYPTKAEREVIFPKDYDPMVPPSPTENNSDFREGPLEIHVKVSVINIRSVKEPDLVIIKWGILNGTIYRLLPQTLIMDIFLHQFWIDHRINVPDNLGKDKIVLDNSFRKQIWMPQTYFKNSIGGSLLGTIFPSIYFTIDGEKNVFMAVRASLSLNCDMKFDNYPHDIQTCTIDLMSLTNTNDTVVLKWRDFRMTSNLYLTRYKVGKTSTEDCTKTYELGSFSCLRGSFELERLSGHHILKLYIPSVLIVLVTFIGFYIPVTAYPARVGLNVTALLSLITLQLHITSTIQTTYIVSINIWMLICIGFVFVGMIEFAAALVLSSREKKQSSERSTTARSSHKTLNIDDSPPSNKEKNRRQSIFGTHFVRTFFIKVHGLEDNTIDLISRRAFPCAFLLFVIIYATMVTLAKHTRFFH
ncbi:glycine receptor subunit alpha-3-like isoform X2 [Brevipalpus obovatus]|uniref:glycine receptor subunit alpha-3-like isoform X2 n=1 Tax=Brevipalpus obovatus TaxID=246614 RepID=UPI003D9F638D